MIKLGVGILMIAVVIMQPLLGWHSIPVFFNYNHAWAFCLGMIDTAMFLGGMCLISDRCRYS